MITPLRAVRLVQDAGTGIDVDVPPLPTRFVLALTPAESASADPAYRFERRSFEREYGVAADDHDAEFAPYAQRSTLVSVTDAELGVVGVMRLIAPPSQPADRPVKTLIEAAGEPWLLDVPRATRAAGIDVRHTWDVATLSVDRSIGRHRITVLGALYHALVNVAERSDVRWLVMTLDERVRSTLRMVGLPTAAIPGAHPRPFCGSQASTPVWGRCVEMLAHQREHSPEAYRLITLGIGLADVELPDRDDYRLTGRAGEQRDTAATRYPLDDRPSSMALVRGALPA